MNVPSNLVTLNTFKYSRAALDDRKSPVLQLTFVRTECARIYSQQKMLKYGTTVIDDLFFSILIFFVFDIVMRNAH